MSSPEQAAESNRPIVWPINLDEPRTLHLGSLITIQISHILWLIGIIWQIYCVYTVSNNPDYTSGPRAPSNLLGKLSVAPKALEQHWSSTGPRAPSNLLGKLSVAPKALKTLQICEMLTYCAA